MLLKKCYLWQTVNISHFHFEISKWHKKKLQDTWQRDVSSSQMLGSIETLPRKNDN